MDQATAEAKNLTFASGDTFIVRVDDTEVLNPSGPGRSSARIMSNEMFDTHVTV